MTTVLLVRHALCDPVGRAIAGWSPGIHLNAAGRAQAAQLAERLSAIPLAAIHSSPLERARETAEAVAARHGLSVVVSEAAGEIRFGDWTGRTLAELAEMEGWREFNTYRSGTRIPGGEMMLEAQTRIVGELERLRAAHDGGFVAVVTHGDIVKAAVAHYAGIPLDLAHRVEVAPASVSAIALERWGARILRVNDTGDTRWWEENS